MTTVNVPLRVSWELMLAPEESAPRLDIWLTQDVSTAVTALDLTAASGTASLRLSFATVHSAVPDPSDRRLRDAVSRCNICFGVTSVVDNGHRERGIIPAGDAIVPLAALRADRAGDVLLTFPMLPQAAGGVKGRLTLQLDGPVLFGGRTLADAGITLRAEPLQAAIGEDYIERAEHDCSPISLRSTYKALDNVNMFRDDQPTGVFPALAYLRRPSRVRAPTTERYFANAARLALRRMRDADEQTALGWRLGVDPTDSRRGAYWLAHTLQMFTVYSNYVEDVVWAAVRTGGGQVRFERTPIEWFQMVRTRMRAGQMVASGDCEDLASETVLAAQELRALRTSDPLLRKLQEVLAAYYVVLMLGGVSAVEINLAGKGGDRHQDAHMNSALLSKYHSNVWRGLPPVGSPVWTSIVVMEGTGPLDANGVEHAQADAIAEQLREHTVNSQRLLDACVREIFHYDSSGKHQSNFYKTIKLVGSCEMDEHSFIFLLAPDRSQRTIGVEFQRVAAADPNITMIAEAPASDALLAAIDRAALNLHPVPPLDGPDESVPAPPHVRRGREAMARVQAVAAQILEANRGAIALPGKPSPTAVHRSIVMMKYEHMDEAGVVANALVQCLRSSAAPSADVPLVSFGVSEERVTADTGGWRIEFGWPEPGVVAPRPVAIVSGILSRFW